MLYSTVINLTRSTPLADSYYGGEDDLAAAAVYEDGDHTTLVFRNYANLYNNNL